jgi:hypothetical protein
LLWHACTAAWSAELVNTAFKPPPPPKPRPADDAVELDGAAALPGVDVPVGSVTPCWDRQVPNACKAAAVVPPEPAGFPAAVVEVAADAAFDELAPQAAASTPHAKPTTSTPPHRRHPVHGRGIRF